MTEADGSGRVPRLRVFAGPNGSGKSTLKRHLPDDKVISRYGRSLDLLSDAVSFTSRAYIFDNSGHEQVWIAEVTQGVELELKANVMPYWVKTALWDKFSAD